MKIAGMEVVESTLIPEGEIHIYGPPRITALRVEGMTVKYMMEQELLGAIVGIENGEEETQEG